MARRRSINRRWSRRSLNVTELDQDSEVIERGNPMWWKNIEGDVTVRPSMSASIAETTGSILDTDSRVDPSELQDKWWDNLDRTKLSSSRRFSAGKSVNPGDTVLESFNSEDDDDISIKKRKVLLHPRPNKSGGTDNFLKVLNESDVTAQSDPLPGKKRSISPTRSDTEVVRKKTRHRRSQAAETSRDNQDDASFTSNDTDIVVKPRPKAFKKRFTGKPRDSAFYSVLQNEGAGPSEINNSINASRLNDSPLSKISANVTPRVIDSNESGLMGPPKAASLRKRLSSISRKLNLTSDESESDGAPKKGRADFAKKSREKLSVNPFDEILSGHLEEENSQNQVQMSKGATVTKTPNKSRRSRGDDPAIGVSTVAYREDQTSTMETVKMSDSTQLQEVHQTQRNSTVDLATTPRGETENLVENNRGSISVSKETTKVSNRLLHSKVRRSLLSRQSTLAKDSQRQVIQDWESSDNEDEALVDKASKSISNVSKGATSIKKTLAVSKTLLSSMRTSRSQRIDESVQESDEDQEMAKDKNRSLRSARHSRIIADSAYELPDKERSDSPIISLSENENDGSVDKSKRNKREKRSSTRHSANRSIPYDNSNVSRKSSSRMNTSTQRINSDESISDEAGQSLEKTNRRSTKRDSRVDDRAKTSRKSAARANISRRQTLDDDIINEEDVDEEAKDNSKSESLGVKEKSNTAGKSASYGNTSRNLFLSEESMSDEEAEDAEKSNTKSTNKSSRAKRNSSRQRVESDESINEEEPEDVEKSNSQSKSKSNSTKRSLRPEGRNTSTARNSSVRADVFGQGIESDDAGDAANSKSANLAAKRKASVARNSSANVSAERRESAESFSEVDEQDRDKTISKSVILSAKRKASEARRSIAHGNVSGRHVESDEGSSKEDAERSYSKSVNLSTNRKINTTRKSAARGNVSGRRIESEEEDNQGGDRSNSKLANLSARRKTSIAKRSSAREYVSEQRIDSDESEEEVEDSENMNPVTAKEANKSIRLPKNSWITQNTTSRNKSTLSTAGNFEDEDSTVPSEVIPLAAELTKLPKNQSGSVLGKSNASRTQKNITDFFQSKFLQKSDLSKTLDLTSFDHEKFKLIRQEMEKIKQQEIEAMKIDVAAKKKVSRRPDNAPKAKNSRSKENVTRAAAKPAKVVDKAFIVNGTVYKRPKLPRPKPWVTDRLYRHLWKKMEPKFDLSTRIKSEKFVEQLSEVVAVTIRRKKYDSYKLELDALMKEMAKLGIIKTRNDFYDFCYDFMPYDFRVKATPILMPGNVRNIPYDPETLHTPILAEASRSG